MARPRRGSLHVSSLFSPPDASRGRGASSGGVGWAVMAAAGGRAPPAASSAHKPPDQIAQPIETTQLSDAEKLRTPPAGPRGCSRSSRRAKPRWHRRSARRSAASRESQRAAGSVLSVRRLDPDVVAFQHSRALLGLWPRAGSLAGVLKLRSRLATPRGAVGLGDAISWRRSRGQYGCTRRARKGFVQRGCSSRSRRSEPVAARHGHSRCSRLCRPFERRSP